MSEEVCQSLTKGTDSGWVRWIRKLADPKLAMLYRNASLFTYLSIYEGFGYPPFEAAHARVPMVVSSVSAVGEIWLKYAKCVNPSNIEEIASAWRWALELKESERQAVVEAQKQRATEFSWKKCICEYLTLYKTVADET